MPYLDTTDPALQAFLQAVRGAFSEKGGTVYLSKRYVFRVYRSDDTIELKPGSRLEFVRVPSRKRRKGDPLCRRGLDGKPTDPYVWWNFFVRYDKGTPKEYPTSFVIDRDRRVFCMPESQKTQLGRFRRRTKSSSSGSE